MIASDSLRISGIADPIAPRPAAAAPRVSVVVPVRNEAQFILRTLGQLAAQRYDPERFEILVVDGQSTDGTPELAREFARRANNVHVFSNPRRLSSAARNIGVRHARGDIIVVVDGHCELDEYFLSNLASAFDRSGAECVGRPQPLDVTNATPLQRAIAAARSSPLGHHPASYIYSARGCFAPAKSVAVAYRREVFDLVGLFDEGFDACEDVEFNHRVDRAGLRCYFSPEIAVRYQPRRTLRGLFYQLFRYGRGRIRLARKHPDTLSAGTIIPLVFVIGLIAGLPLSLTNAWLGVAYVSALALYAAILVLGSLWIGVRRKCIALVPMLVAVFATIHVGSGIGMLFEALHIRRSTAVRPRSLP
jgi:succinoglycan biosynthesis protein ExoA